MMVDDWEQRDDNSIDHDNDNNPDDTDVYARDSSDTDESIEISDDNDEHKRELGDHENAGSTSVGM